MKVHTESIAFKADQKLVDYVVQKVNKLEHYFDRIIDAEVKLRLENSGQVRGKIAEVQIQVPGQRIFAKETDKSFELSVDRACEDLRRQLTRYKERMRSHGDGVVPSENGVLH